VFIPHTEKERHAMLQAIGVNEMSQLFKDVPSDFRFPSLDLPPSHTEMEALEEVKSIAAGNGTAEEYASFLGAGAYHHYIPAGVDAILRRGEFYTAYTPYQPEVSQGTLQAIFEYQSLMIALTGMEASNASHYDGATALAEAVNMARGIHRGKRKKVILSPAIHPQYREVVHAYEAHSDLEIVGEDLDPVAGLQAIMELIDEETSIVCVANPDFFGRIHDYSELAEKVHEAGALLCISINPISLGLFKTPGDMGADIVTGEGQPLGIPLSFGGPYLGILTTKEKYVRSLAGRIAGETTDVNGQRGYVLTLSTREQHIRRERASSNICTNQGLMMLAATVYISLMGKSGLKQVAETSYHKAHYAADILGNLEGYELLFPDQTFFNEFALKLPAPASQINAALLEEGIIGGYDLGRTYPGHENSMLLAFTEMNSREEIDFLAQSLKELPNG
jgi:glycine dehydrogenase subunit 1